MQDVGREVHHEVKQRMRSSESRGQQQREPYSFYNNNEDDEVSGDSKEDEDEGDRAEEEEYATEKDDLAVGDELPYPSETDKRREQRHAEPARDREGEIQRETGFTRNYTLIDENTREPYGPRVSQWRKELMLLSRKLDPAIRYIKNQPETLVKEIADWIQHTGNIVGQSKTNMSRR